uniref:Uncharacterized protein n=1 Tax=Haptolina brevifila TaxID=156173 RepID=A0A7S2I0S6_9EUKA
MASAMNWSNVHAHDDDRLLRLDLADVREHLGSSGRVSSTVFRTMATQHLFKPRPWVQRIVSCYLHECGVVAENFITTFIRMSPEKEAEDKAHGVQVATLAEHVNLTLAEYHEWALPPVVYLQTSNPHALSNFKSAMSSAGMRVCYTDNLRSEHDTWGGRINSDEQKMSDAVTGVVNLAIGSQATAFVSSSSSSWTWLTSSLMNRTIQPQSARSCKKMSDSSLVIVSRGGACQQY